MKNKIKKQYLLFGAGLAVLIVLLLIISFCCVGHEKENKNLTLYNLSLLYDEQNHILSGSERVNYVNNYDNMFDCLYFHLYPNAFREGAKNGVVSASNIDTAYPNGLSYGWIDIQNVTYENGEKASFNICGEDENILEIKLAEELYPDENVEINIYFETKLANINHRLGYGENTINFGNFYPIACVYESGIGFSQSLYHSNGDPFYSECANYEVEIEFNSAFELATTGVKEKVENGGGKKVDKIFAKNVRDFCFVLSDKFECVSQIVDGIEVNYYGYQNDENLAKCLKTGIDALQTFGRLFGDYPYSQLSIVKSNFVHGGMEYPNIVLISDEVLAQKDYEYVIIHEIAHQWWYGVVGNDEYNHAWLDEGLAEYSTLMFYQENPEYGEDFEGLVKSSLESYKLFEKVYIKVTGSVDGSMDRAICDFATEPEYVQCTYTKGVIMFNTLREMVGDKKFKSALKNYYHDFMFKNASPADLIAQFVSSCGKSTEGFFNSWLEGKVVIQ